jgi:hypothetical protein
MRILKALAAVSAGILLLTLPAVATPQAPQEPGDPGQECVEPDAETDEEADLKAEEEGDKKVEKTADEDAPVDPCVVEEEPQSKDPVSGLLQGLGLN